MIKNGKEGTQGEKGTWWGHWKGGQMRGRKQRYVGLITEGTGSSYLHLTKGRAQNSAWQVLTVTNHISFLLEKRTRNICCWEGCEAGSGGDLILICQ